MELQAAKAPNIRYKENVHTLFTDVIIALLPLYAMAFFYYGPRTVVMGLYAAALCFVVDLLARRMAGRTIKLNDFSAVLTGLIIALLLPATAPYYVLVAACLFAMLIAKHPFGGLGANLFNPACAGLAFGAVCWPEAFFRFPKPFDQIPVLLTAKPELVQSPASVLKIHGEPSGDLLLMLLGNFSGPMGATSILVIVSCLFFLLIRRTITWHIPVSLLVSAGAFALLFPRVQFNAFISMIYELLAGCIVFGAAFVASDPVTSPSLPAAKIWYGAGIGILTMLFRYFGGFEEGFIFAVLLMNALAFSLDRFALWLRYDFFSTSVHSRFGYGSGRPSKKILVTVDPERDAEEERVPEHENEKEGAQEPVKALAQGRGGSSHG